ncbi:protein of unknown function [Agrobacterium pusense]|uniref:Uncharacterized protein n=1 Tax=Agrobacterium pusense TaxID=648995 RepID=U4Q3G0_9HYPH|nr:protein of unknown function [Agrobacterium pusense]
MALHRKCPVGTACICLFPRSVPPLLDGRLQKIQGDETFVGLTGLAPADVNREKRRNWPHGGPNVPVRYAF